MLASGSDDVQVAVRGATGGVKWRGPNASNRMTCGELSALRPRPPAVAYAPVVPDLRERWRSGWFEATAYDWAIEHERVARGLGQLISGTNTSAFYRDIARLPDLRPGTSVLDIPYGGGVAFAAFEPSRISTTSRPTCRA